MSTRDVSALKTLNWQGKLMLREVWVVTQWKDDCVYKTRSLGLVVNPVLLTDDPKYIVGSVSTKVSRQLL